MTPGAGCWITPTATVSTTGVTGCFTFRAAFLTGERLGFALAPARFAVLDAPRAFGRLAEFVLRSFARFLRLAMIDPPQVGAPQRIACRIKGQPAKCGNPPNELSTDRSDVGREECL